jgi:hypothetical protein
MLIDRKIDLNVLDSGARYKHLIKMKKKKYKIITKKNIIKEKII